MRQKLANDKQKKEADQEKYEEKEHSKLQASAVNLDVPMDLLEDFNHVITFYLTNDEQIKISPTTGLSDIILMHDRCETCWSMIDAKWTPDWTEPVGGVHVPITEKEFSYIYMMHIEDVKA